MTTPTKIYVWPDGTYADNERDLQDLLQWKSDDYREIILDDTFDLEKQLFGDDDASTGPA